MFCLNSFGQNIDTSQSQSQTKRVENIELHLNKFRSQNLTGTWLMIMGGVIAGTSSIAMGKDADPAIKIGILFGVIGFGVQLNSFHHLKFKR